MDILPAAAVIPAFIGCVLIGGVYLLYLWALPKPIPGIPYHKGSTKQLLGDAGAMMKHVAGTKEIHSWVVAQNVELQSPIIQLFARPFAKPWVVITDYWEAQDILTRRTKEFDRSQFMIDVAGGMLPYSHLNMPTNDEWRKHRKWVQGVMNTSFHRNVSAPHLYAAARDLVDLWEQKTRLAKGHAFAAVHDLHSTTMDAVCNVLFGTDVFNSILKTELQLYAAIKEVDLPDSLATPVALPAAPYSEDAKAFLYLMESVEKAMQSATPTWSHWWLRQTNEWKVALKRKDDFVDGEIRKSLQRIANQPEKNVTPTCAVDDMVQRELVLAAKEKRAHQAESISMNNEIFGIIVGAQDTTATTTAWGLKLLADNPDVQTKLRVALTESFPDAVAQRRSPTCDEVVSVTCHYRDAVIEEVLRCSNTESGAVRQTQCDVRVLGHIIPKGVDVFLMGNGPSQFSPAFPIDDSKRTKSYFETKDHVSAWDKEGMQFFNPERWLVKQPNGERIFDQNAGPLLVFGLGERGCIGKKMAYLELKMFTTLLFWTLEFGKCSKELSGYAAVDKITHSPQQCFIRPSLVS